jgi:hypothetical protein
MSKCAFQYARGKALDIYASVCVCVCQCVCDDDDDDDVFLFVLAETK